jgi:hypothetical protein
MTNKSKTAKPKTRKAPVRKRGLTLKQAAAVGFEPWERLDKEGEFGSCLSLEGGVNNPHLGRVLINTGHWPNVRSWGEPEMPGWWK